MLGYDANYINPYTRYDLVKAKELLKKAGYPNGEKLPQIRLLVQNTISSRQIGEFFAKNMREIDIDVLVVPVELEELSRIVQSGRGDFHVAKYEHRGYFAEPEDFLKILYGKIDPEYDRMYRKLSSPKNTEKDKKVLLNKMRTMAVEKVNIIPLVNPYSFTLVRPNIKNYKPHTLVGKRFKFIKVEE
jgi:ABC-type transport system substrate-binding protein